MEFEELQKIWIADKQETVYAINEKALHHRISSKKNTMLHIANVSELLLITVNLCSAVFIWWISDWNNGSVFIYLMAAWMFLTCVYVLVKRMRRLQEQPKFDRSVREELQHAVSTATYQVRLSQLMRLNVLPIGAFSILSVWDAHKPVWFAIGIFVFLGIVYYLSGWEHRIYKNKKKELESLQNNLEKQ